MGIIYNVTSKDTLSRNDDFNNQKRTALDSRINSEINQLCQKYSKNQHIDNTIRDTDKAITKLLDVKTMCSIKQNDDIVYISTTSVIIKDNHLQLTSNGSTIKFFSHGKIIIEVQDISKHSLPEMLSNALDLFDLADDGKEGDDYGLKNKYDTLIHFTNLYVLPKINQEAKLNINNLPEFSQYKQR